MTKEEAAEYLSMCADGYDGAFDKAVEMAIAALRAQAKAEKNEPLTLEELWQAKKQWEPVYAVSVDGADIFPKRWSVPCVLDCTVAYGCGQTESIVAIYGKNLTLSESEYGRTWLAYRRKPENGRH